LKDYTKLAIFLRSFCQKPKYWKSKQQVVVAYSYIETDLVPQIQKLQLKKPVLPEIPVIKLVFYIRVYLIKKTWAFKKLSVLFF